MGAVLINFEPFLIVVHFVVSVVLIAVILLQSGKGTDLSSMFGAGGSQSLFGASGGGNFLTKVTTVAAVIFIMTSLGLATISNFAATGGGESSVIEMEDEKAVVDQEGQKEAKPVKTEEKKGE